MPNHIFNMALVVAMVILRYDMKVYPGNPHPVFNLGHWDLERSGIDLAIELDEHDHPINEAGE